MLAWRTGVPVAIWSATPISRPCMSTSGPPELWVERGVRLDRMGDGEAVGRLGASRESADGVSVAAPMTPGCRGGIVVAQVDA